MPTLQERHCARVSTSKRESGRGSKETAPTCPKSWPLFIPGSHLWGRGCGQGLSSLSDIFRHESHSPLKQICDGQVYTPGSGWEKRGRVSISCTPSLPQPTLPVSAILSRTQVSLDDIQWHMGQNLLDSLSQSCHLHIRRTGRRRERRLCC